MDENKTCIKYKISKNLRKPEEFLGSWNKFNIQESSILENPSQEQKKSLDTYEQSANATYLDINLFYFQIKGSWPNQKGS